tara:strand:- start:1981 stop:2235 length:255 start_codon:yes stop_codon:yes gene_type:complete
MDLRTKRDKNKALTINGVCHLMANKSKVSSVKQYKPELTALDINSQIAEFFKSGGEVQEVTSETRSMPEWTWWQDTYPKNYNRR